MFGQKEANELIKKGQIEVKELLSGTDMYRGRTAAAKFLLQEKRRQHAKRQQDKDVIYETIQEGRKQSEEADRLRPGVEVFLQKVWDLQLRHTFAHANLNAALATEPPNIRKIREASDRVRALSNELTDQCIDIDCDV